MVFPNSWLIGNKCYLVILCTYIETHGMMEVEIIAVYCGMSVDRSQKNFTLRSDRSGS